MVISDSKPLRTHMPDSWASLLGLDPSEGKGGPAQSFTEKYAAVTGVREETVLSDAEWEEFMRYDVEIEDTAALEEAENVASGHALLDKDLPGKRAMGDGRVSVIHAFTVEDIRKVYEYGCLHGYGTAEGREEVRRAIEAFRMSRCRGRRSGLGCRAGVALS
ncbi:hypothetical protein MRB53_039819 [Persea americana]|nr:hypothetical protein MRB53_039819 [Persea americana]